jgi:hypothetical protein
MTGKEGIHLITRADTKIPVKARGWDAMTETAFMLNAFFILWSPKNT